jgi:predicted dehydrogenase
MVPVRVGLIGCGEIARAVHLNVLRRLPAARLVAVAEPIEANRTAAATLAQGVLTFTDYQELIDEAELDAVVICLPPHLHASSAIAAFDAGLHVYLEKPLAPSVAEGEPVIAAWRRAGRVGMIGFNFRFHPQVVDMRERLRRGEIGTPLAVRAVFSIASHATPAWKQTRALGGGALLDLASHHVDLLHYLFDEPVIRAWASVRSLQSEGDHAWLEIELASGTRAQLFVSLGSVDEHRMEIVGTAGKLVMDRTELLRAAFVGATLRGARVHRLGRALSALDPRLLIRSPGVEPSFARALEVFVHAAAGGHFAGPDLSDGARCVAVIEGAERSLPDRV